MMIKKIFFFIIFQNQLLCLRNPFEYVSKFESIELISSGTVNGKSVAVVKILNEIKTIKIGYVFNDHELIKINSYDIIFQDKNKKIKKIFTKNK